MEDAQEIQDFVEQRLDMDYVKQTGEAVAQALRDEVPIEANFQPGDGTSYRLVFVPIQEIRCAPPRVAPIRDHDERPVAWDERCSFGAGRRIGSAVISWVEQGAVALDLAGGGYVGPYLAGLFRTTEASGVALSLLFTAIAEALS